MTTKVKAKPAKSPKTAVKSPVTSTIPAIDITNHAIVTLNQSSDLLTDTRHKIAFLQEALSPEREEVYLDWEALSGANIILTQVFNELLITAGDLAQAGLKLQKIE